MTRDLDSLKHLTLKLQGRHGESDPHVQLAGRVLASTT
jgi:hypothetical protein